MLRAQLTTTFRYVAWANQRTLEALRATPAALNEALPLLAHLLAAEHIWLARLERREPHCAVWPTLNLGECASLLAENAAGYQAFIDRLGEDPQTDAVRYRTRQGQEFSTSVLDILMHVITHGPYHRGQIAKAIGRNGGSAVNTDYITFVRESGPVE